MTATILDGKATLAAVKIELRARIDALAARGVVPGLGTVLVGDDPASQWYVRAKHKDRAEIGINSIARELPTDSSLADVLAVVDDLNANAACTAFLVQQPTGLDEFAILSRVHPSKGVDGLRPFDLGRENATVTLCHNGTRDLAGHVRRADIVVVAGGVPGLITDMVKPGAAVLDVEVSRVAGRIAGDVAAEVVEVAGFVAPNPGGVGPMTRAMLLSNVVDAAERLAAEE